MMMEISCKPRLSAVWKLRVDESSSGANERKKFTGYEYDPTADLNYAKARYYGQNEGRFLNQDPVFVNLGVDVRTQAALAVSPACQQLRLCEE